MKKRLENALKRIEVPKGLDEAAACGIRRAKSERTGIKMTRSLKIIAATAAALAVCTVSVAGAAIGGRLVDIKNNRGAITGQQLVDATDYFDVSLSYSGNDNSLKVEAVANENAKNEPYFGEFDSIRAASFSITNDKGEVIAELGEDGTLDFEYSDAAFSDDGALTIVLKDGTEVKNCQIHVSKLIGSKKGDQDLEIFGNWDADVKVTYTFVEEGFDSEDSEMTISRVVVDDEGNVTYYDADGNVVDRPPQKMEEPTKSSSTFDFSGEPFFETYETTDENGETLPV